MKNIFKNEKSVINEIIIAVIVVLITTFIELIMQSTEWDENNYIVIVVILCVFTILITLFFIEKNISRISNSQDNLIKKLGVHAELISYDEPKLINTFKYFEKYILGAEKSIVALDYHQNEFVYVDPDFINAYNNWYTVLNNIVVKKEIEYMRIIQLNNPKSVLSSKDGFNETVLNHFKFMIDADSSQICLKSCKVFLPHMCLIIIDNKYVIWEIPTVEDNKMFRFDMDLFIIDPDGDFIKSLNKEIRKIENNSTLVKKVVIEPPSGSISNSKPKTRYIQDK